jgi:hypothetical protein
MALGKRRDESGRPIDPMEQSKVIAVEPKRAESSPVASVPARSTETKKPADEPVVVTRSGIVHENKYRVTADKRISWGSSMIRLKKGAVVSESTHGQGAMDRMLAAGVALELVKG